MYAASWEFWRDGFSERASPRHFLWLQSPEMDIVQVRGCASRGEHDVLIEDVKRRYYRGLFNVAEVLVPQSRR
jgi:predicted ABC-type ATPase